MSNESFFATALIPVFLSSFLPSLSWSVILISWLLSLISATIVRCASEAPLSYSLIIIAHLSTFFTLHSHRYQLIVDFLFQKKILDESGFCENGNNSNINNPQLLMQHDAVEWRNMLANIAHDLKTVSGL